MAPNEGRFNGGNVNNVEKLVRKFGDQTRIKTNEIAKRLGVVIDSEYLDKCFAIQWAMASIVAEEAGEVIEFNEDIASKAESASPNEMGVAFCLNSCRGGFYQIESGEYDVALETFGLVRSIHGYLLKNDYRKFFSVAGAKGGVAKNAKMNKVKERMLDKFHELKDKNSVRSIAKRLEGVAKEVAAEEGTRFTTDDVFSRLYSWFLNDKKSTMPSR